ncbi:MAG TPA: ATP-binding protein [Terriglobales bacterium]|nr:ATP-binding protein [Terriglobales bacterium]
MRGTEQGGRVWRSTLGHSLGAKLIWLLLGAMVVIFALLGLVTIRLHRQHLEAATLQAAERVSDVIKRSTTYSMMRNDRQGLYHMMTTIAGEPGVVRVRIFDQQGKISYSTDLREVNRNVDKGAEACYGCHAQSQPLARLNRPDRFRIYKSNGHRVLGIITPIENQPSCSNAACHAHPASQQILGVLDTNLSLAAGDASLAQGTRRLLAYTGVAVLLIAFLSWIFVWQVVQKPVKRLTAGTQKLSAGERGYQIAAGSSDELGELADSFNRMSLQLRRDEEELTTWARTLEDRVEDKTRELKRAHEHVLQVEKMASVGKLAAVVAHEINNPLSSILTYAKLLRKWMERPDGGREKREEAEQCLEVIAGESRRCGDLVKNLLTFSRVQPINLQPTDISAVVNRCYRLVQHQLEISNIQWQLDIAPDLPLLICDGAQIEQVLLALVMNAIDAMPRGGNLWLSAMATADGRQLELRVRDDGCGIAPEILPQIFEPFLTTKEMGHGVGLGLAISRSIVERHGGGIEAQSELGRGTTFIMHLPLQTEAREPVGAELAAAGKARQGT